MTKKVTIKAAALNAATAFTPTASVDSSNPAEIVFDGQDTKIAILLNGSLSGTVTVKGARGNKDLVVPVSGTDAVIVLDSYPYKDDSGKVTLTPTATCSVAAVLLP